MLPYVLSLTIFGKKEILAKSFVILSNLAEFIYFVLNILFRIVDDIGMFNKRKPYFEMLNKKG